MVGIEDEGQTGEAVCPNCGKRGLDDGPSIECGGDRVLVEKFMLRVSPARALGSGGVSIFRESPSQAYVKRVVGLPGESIRSKAATCFVNDRIARKSLAEIRAMRMLVHDSRFQPEDAARSPRWLFRPACRGNAAGLWKREGDRFVHSAGALRPAAPPEDWLVYKHWDSGRGGYGA